MNPVRRGWVFLSMYAAQINERQSFNNLPDCRQFLFGIALKLFKIPSKIAFPFSLSTIL